MHSYIHKCKFKSVGEMYLSTLTILPESSDINIRGMNVLDQNTHSKNLILPPSRLLCQTVPNPPTWTRPRMMTTMLAIIITVACRKSVQTTALIPPWKLKPSV